MRVGRDFFCTRGKVNDREPWRPLSKKAAAAADMPDRLSVTQSRQSVGAKGSSAMGAARGHVAALPSPVMKSRRRIVIS